VNLSAVGGDGKIDLSWAVTGNIRTIQVIRDTDADPAGRLPIAMLNGKARSYTDTKAVNGQQYWYWIRYTDTAGRASYSNAGNASARGNGQPSPTPTAPSGLSAAVSGTTVSLKWTDQSNTEQGFRVERQLSGDTSWTLVTDTTANVISYVDRTVALGKTYVYRVYAFNAAGSSMAVTASATTGAPSANGPSAPIGLNATVLDNTLVNLVWSDKSNNEQGFHVQRRVTGDATWTTLADTVADAQSYRDTAVVMGTSYEYRVFAFNSAGNSEVTSAPATIQTLKKYGEQQYAAQNCVTCHGSNGKGGLRPLTKQYALADVSTLAKFITGAMPDRTGKCQGNCALGTATYLIDIMGSANAGAGQVCTGTVPPSTRSLRLLTRMEYQNTVNDLLGLNVSLFNSMPQENRVDGFDNNIASNLVTSLRLESFLAQSQSLAAQAVENSFNKLVSCNTQDTACARQFIQTFGKKAYRRPLTTVEQSDYLTVFSKNSFSVAVELGVAQMLASPHFLYRSELGTKQSDGSYRLTSYEVASSLSYLFLGTMPDDALLLAADQNELATTEQQLAQATRLLDLPTSRKQVGNFVGQWLLSSNPYTLPDKDMGVYPNYAQAKLSMSEELINFVNHVVFDSTQKFSELFTSTYAVVNKDLADYYGLSGSAGTSYTAVEVPDGTRTGIMTLGAVLSRYANSNESHPFKRGAFVYKRLLCDDLPFPANAGIVAAPKPDPNATTRERFNFHSNSGEACVSCHKFLDPAGFGFENYDGAGQFRATEKGRPVDATGTLLGLETFTDAEKNSFNNLGDLSKLVANSPNASQCVARQYYRFTTGKREETEDECAVNSFIDSYKASDYNLKSMLLGIVSSPGFTVRRSN